MLRRTAMETPSTSFKLATLKNGPKAMESLSTYLKLSTLKNGRKLQIRPLNNNDQERLEEFLQWTPHKVLQFCKQDMRNWEVVKSWLDPTNGYRVISLVAIELDTKQFIGHILLAMGQHTAVKIGEIQQILVAQTLQGLGLGAQLLDSLIHLAIKENLHWLKVEVVTDLKHVIKVFESRGFRTRAILEDYFTDKKGKMYDVALMLRPLVKQKVDF